jgi:hypothetical protein
MDPGDEAGGVCSWPFIPTGARFKNVGAVCGSSWCALGQLYLYNGRRGSRMLMSLRFLLSEVREFILFKIVSKLFQ